MILNSFHNVFVFVVEEESWLIADKDGVKQAVSVFR